MIALGLILLAWLLLSVAVLRPHARVLRAWWHEPVLACPVVIVESDDWGPGPAEDAAMLQRIANLLSHIRDREGRPAVMTLGVVLGRPDGPAILADGCRFYRRSLLDEPTYAPIVAAMLEGCAMGVFALQRHGLEHCWPDSLLSRAREDAELRRWLADPEARSETLPSALQSRWVDTATLPSRLLPAAEIEAAVKEEGDVFLRIFGGRPSVAVPNTFVWSAAVERAWAADGVQCVVTCGRQYEGRKADGGLLPPTRPVFNGERGLCGVRYVVRDLYFEPIRGHRAEQVWQGVAERVALGRPALIETHRESFIAGPLAAEQALADLARALGGVLQRYPDACFLSTAALSAAMAAPAPPIFAKTFAVRLYFFLRRLLATPVMSRPLKLSGLRLLLPVLIQVLALASPAQRAPHTGC